MGSKKAYAATQIINHQPNALDPDYIAELIVKHWFNELGPDEKTTLEKWKNASPENWDEFKRLITPPGMLDAIAERFPSFGKPEAPVPKPISHVPPDPDEQATPVMVPANSRS
jgi:hypothetical protein